MAYDEKLADRVRTVFGARKDLGEIEMFGGLCFTINGNMCVGVEKDRLMVRVGPDRHDAAMAMPGAKPMDFTKRVMKGFVFVERDGFASAAALKKWVRMSLDYVEPMPPKKPKSKRRPARTPASTRSR